jgi:hypothetical protein
MVLLHYRVIPGLDPARPRPGPQPEPAVTLVPAAVELPPDCGPAADPAADAA